MISNLRSVAGSGHIDLPDGYVDIQYGRDKGKLPAVEVLWEKLDGTFGGCFIPIRVLAAESLEHAVARTLSVALPRSIPEDIRTAIADWANGFA